MFEVNLETNDIFITRGDTGILKIGLTDKQTGEEYVPQQGDSIRLAVAKDYGVKKADCVIFKNVDINTLLVEFTPQDTKKLDFATYHYDVELTDAFGHNCTFIQANFTVGKEVY